MISISDHGNFEKYIETEMTNNPLFRTYSYISLLIDGKETQVVAFTIQPIDINLRLRLYDHLPNVAPNQEILASVDDKMIPLESFKVVNNTYPYMNYLLVEHFELVKHEFHAFHFTEKQIDSRPFRYAARHTKTHMPENSLESMQM